MGILGIYVRKSVDKENTSIEQQINEGVKFCKKNKFEYQVYEDKGKSGFKIEKNDPFKNLQGLKKLLDDIEKGIINKVWVWEHSRSSRDKFLSYYQVDIYKKYNVIIYEKGKEIDLNIPENEFLQDILTGYSILERHKIIERTKRGLHDSINRGIRGYQSLYGYKKDGKDNTGHTIWKPVNSEIEKIKYCFKYFLEGQSINSIITDVFKNKLTEKNRTTLINKCTRILTKFDYTGYSLNIDGGEIFKKYMKSEIDNIRELNNKKYYVKSTRFPIQCVSLDNYFNIVEKIHKKKLIYKDKMRKTDTDFVTGIINCPYCELKYYVTNDKGFIYYKHFPKKQCHQLPKSIRVEKINNLYSLFFFYFYLVYDDTKRLIEESQRLIKINQLEIKEKIKTIEIDNRKLDKQINNFESIYEDCQDIDKLNLILEKEKQLIVKKENNNIILLNLKNELDNLNIKFDKDKLELTYYDIKKILVNFFENMSIEEKRESLIKIISNCQLFGKYLIIDTGKLLFIFYIDNEYLLSDNTYNKFKKDKNFKNNFMNSSSVIDNEGILNIINDWKKYNDNYKNKNYKHKELTYKEKQKNMENLSDYFIVRNLGDIKINEIFLKNKYNSKIRIRMEKKLNEIGIDYDISNIEKIISFTDKILLNE